LAAVNSRAARKSQQFRCDLTDTITDAFSQRLDGLGEPGDVGQLVTGKLSDQPRLGHQPLPQQIAVLSQVERTRLGGAFGIEFMHPPQQAVDRRCALRNKVFATIHQELELA
jgi:hypothetical protein